MELIDAIKWEKVYFDTNIIIYSIDWNWEFRDIAIKISDYIHKKELSAVTSYLSMSEILPYFIRDKDIEKISKLIFLIKRSWIYEISPMDFETFFQAGALRANLWLKTPDALHVASAMQAGCTLFLTNDAGIRVPEGMKLLLLSDFL